jgi:Rrf2 family iron-sulfur cluster assembly transcriptional regulator
MLELALQQDNDKTPIVDMAKKYNLSQSSMEQLFARLRQSGLVAGRRGRHGGYRLAKAPADITLAEIVASVDDEYGAGRGVRKTASPDDRTVGDAIFDCLSQELYRYLEHVTLDSAMKKSATLDMSSVEIVCRDNMASQTSDNTYAPEALKVAGAA